MSRDQHRLTELETRVAFQDDTIQQLNEVITRHEKSIQRLERGLDLLKRQLALVAPSLIAPSAEETPPPHY
jgi:SlyX protein